ncbi:MAG: hypothetical protein EXS64_14865 [Candidatus Latescibacteria bacterium]|nr:hypothetical protein [Candidatus Latescibacterota bacterium]
MNSSLPANDPSMLAGIGFVDPRRLGAAGDGRADDTPAFRAALAEIGTARGTLVLGRGAFRVNTLTVPENVDLLFVNGGRLVVPEGEKLTVLGGIDAPPVTIFDGAVEGAPRVHAVYPQWFGARGDGATDDAPALQKAADLAHRSFGRLLFIPAGRYLIESSLTLRCNVECRGTLVKQIALDPSRHVAKDPFLFLPADYARRAVAVQIADDQPGHNLDPATFHGVRENSFKLPAFRDLPLADDPTRRIDLEEGGTIILSSTDFFTSRNDERGDSCYDRNDCSQLVSPLGDVYPEFAFDYPPPPEAPDWSADVVYRKGDYCHAGGVLYKATWPSGAGAGYEHPHWGRVDIGPHSPEEGGTYRFSYADGAEDRLILWRKVATTVAYSPPQRPLTINGLDIEVLSAEPLDGPRLINDGGTVVVSRSNVTLNDMRLACVDGNCMLSSLCSTSRCCNVTFNRARVSGATYHGLGYNLLHSNCANITYHNCVSINCRDALAGRHGKNILVDGGHYNRVDDHYGRNITVRNAEIHAVSTTVPGYCTPQADLSQWRFVPSVAFVFGGCNFRIESCRVVGCSSVFSGRGDTADLYGTITLRDITVEAEGDVSLFSHTFRQDFDFAHRVRVPDRLTIENVTLTGPGRFRLLACGGPDSPYGPVLIRNCHAIGDVQGREVEYTFDACSIANAKFEDQGNLRCSFRNCTFSGELTGIDPAGVGFSAGNLLVKGARLPFVPDSVDDTIYERKAP